MANENSYPWQHTQSPRGFGHVAASRSYEGRFGRMFRELPPALFSEVKLGALARSMVSPANNVPLQDAQGSRFADQDENLKIPAGYTYLGQFITHDLTFDPSPLGDRQNDPEGVLDFRTPRFDLDSLYGRGPVDQPYMYQTDGKLLVGESRSTRNQFAGPDLPRATNGRAIIGDPRNDENKIISQFHALFTRFHNVTLDRLRGDFDAAQLQVRWAYQWLVVNDFLPRLVPRAIIDSILVPDEDAIHDDDYVKVPGGPSSVRRFEPKLRHFIPRKHAFMPVEFTAAAFRFGHSMVRPAYLLNDLVRPNASFRIPLFAPGGSWTDDLRAFGPLPENWGIQWGYFFDLRKVSYLPQGSYLIDETLALPLASLPNPIVTEGASALAQRTLNRGVQLGLPSGQDVASLLGMSPLDDEELFPDPGLRAIFSGSAPLWYYVLREATVHASGVRLGPVGATIVAEVIIGLLWHDPQSYLRRAPRWRPKFGDDMAALIREVGAPI